MASFNRAMLIGNLTRDPEVRATPTGISVADLRLAVNEDYKDKNGQVVKRTCFVDVVVWDKQAELCRKYLTRGSTVYIEGRLQMDEWTTQDGQKRSKIRVRADRVQFLGSPKGAGSAPQGSRDEDFPLPAEDLEEAAPVDEAG